MLRYGSIDRGLKAFRSLIVEAPELDFEFDSDCSKPPNPGLALSLVCWVSFSGCVRQLGAILFLSLHLCTKRFELLQI